MLYRYCSFFVSNKIDIATRVVVLKQPREMLPVYKIIILKKEIKFVVNKTFNLILERMND